MSEKSMSSNSASVAAAAVQPAPANAPKEQPSAGNSPIKEPGDDDKGKMNVTEPKHSDGKK